jgi:hypothetical protein
MPDAVPVVLLARLALDRSEQREALGGHLLVDALRRCVRGCREFGARAVAVDVIDDQAAAFYRHFDFHQLHDRWLWRRLADVTRAVGDVDRRRAPRPKQRRSRVRQHSFARLLDGVVAVDHLAAMGDDRFRQDGQARRSRRRRQAS